ncbi:helix-turn-helix transcriptional regulator [Fluviicola sp.]|uniref:helix-turn-helix transcriptional regulator n=1 Tax=Fluviicola sp. TaxID=1917219 RepID=UPI0031D02D02
MIIDAPNKLRNLRIIHNKTPKEMGDMLNISDRAYCKLESGETDLTVKRINEISKIFGVQAMDWLGTDHKQVFNNCYQKGNIGINYVQMSDKLVEQYEEHILSLKEQIKTLTALLVQ